MPNETVYGGKDKIILANKSAREEWKKDARFIAKSGVDKNNLFLTITYSGGCKEHNFELIAWNYFVMKPNETQVDVLLCHDSNSDPCKAIIKKELCFDLSPLKSDYHKFFHSKSGTIVLLLGDLKIRYEF